MDIFAYSMIGLGLAMDAAAVSMCKGLAVCQVKPKHCFIAGAYFGIFSGHDARYRLRPGPHLLRPH